MDGIDKITGVLNGVARQLDELAESLDASNEEIADMNTGKTAEEIAQEDALVSKIAAPIVNALDGISAILNGATAQVCEMTAELIGGCKETDA
jgi:hypothetical protein